MKLAGDSFGSSPGGSVHGQQLLGALLPESPSPRKSIDEAPILLGAQQVDPVLAVHIFVHEAMCILAAVLMCAQTLPCRRHTEAAVAERPVDGAGGGKAVAAGAAGPASGCDLAAAPPHFRRPGAAGTLLLLCDSQLACCHAVNGLIIICLDGFAALAVACKSLPVCQRRCTFFAVLADSCEHPTGC